MSKHIRLYGRPLHVGREPAPLSLAGDFPNYQPGVDYEGRINIVNSIGACSVELLSGELPTGYQLFVDQAAKQVVLRWPGFTAVEPVTEIPNGDFQQGRAGWQLPTGWAVESYEKPDITPTPAPGNLAAVCRALGRGDHVMDSDRYPCAPGASVNASGLWDQGPSNKDNVNLFTGVAFFDENGNELAEFLGNRIHDETNKQRHVSSVTGAIAPIGTASAALRNIVHRRNSRNREVIVDDCQWSLAFMSEVASETYCITIRVRDSAGRTADWAGCMEPDLRSPGFDPTTWAFTTGGAVISNDNLTVEFAPNDPWRNAVTTVGYGPSVTGLFYAEFICNRLPGGGGSPYPFVGAGLLSLSNQATPIGSGTSTSNSVQSRSNNAQGGAYSIGGIGVGTVVGVCVEPSTGKVWIRNSGIMPTAWPSSGDPVAGTDPHRTITGSSDEDPIHALASVSANSMVTINTMGPFVGDLPNGALPWDHMFL